MPLIFGRVLVRVLCAALNGKRTIFINSFEIKAFGRLLIGELTFHPFQLVTHVKTAAVSKALR